MASNKKYWKSVEELKGSSVVETLQKNEFVENIPTDDFLGDKETLSKVCWLYNGSSFIGGM
jgi:MoCo/4Fe-4S cofactor protein with predicted Tat translocation signal